MLTGYGVKVERPFIFSLLTILAFAFLYWAANGIVKIADGKCVQPSFIDYLYHSFTTFTSLGYANIQPNIANGPLPQILVIAESMLGVLLIGLIIFTITYRVSR